MGIQPQMNGRGAAVNSPRPDTGKGKFPMHPHDTSGASSVKTCTKCGATKPATTEYFHRHRGGLKPTCKACCAEQARVYHEANQERDNERSRSWYQANKERHYKQSRARHEANKERMAEYYRAYYEANRERILERVRAWHEANKERVAERKRAYYEANKGRDTKRARVWRHANPEKIRAASQRRRSHKQQAEGSFAAQDIQAQYKQQKGRCYYCGIKVGKEYHIDHVVPLSRGGTNWPENLVIACPSCNLSKKDRLPHEWPQGGRLL